MYDVFSPKGDLIMRSDYIK